MKKLSTNQTCEHCGRGWEYLTDCSWWLSFDRCTLCMRKAAGVEDRLPTDVESAPFRVGALRLFYSEVGV